MDPVRPNKWIAFWFFLPSSLALAYFVFYLATFTPEKAIAQPNPQAPYTRTFPPSPEKVILSKGHPQTVGKVKMTYIGMKADRLLIDITILDLDPDYAYRRTISKQKAEQGFQVNQQQYRLVSAHCSKIKLVRTNG